MGMLIGVALFVIVILAIVVGISYWIDRSA
jgi:hypothetical protein